MKRQRDPQRRRHEDRPIDRTCRRIAASSCLRLALALCLLSYADGGGVTLPSASPVASQTCAWLLKQARARFGGSPIDEAAAPDAVKAARPTTLFVTAFRRGQSTRPLTGSGPTLLAALKAALDSLASNTRPASSASEAAATFSRQTKRAAKAQGAASRPANPSTVSGSAPDRIQIDILDGELAPLEKPAETERDEQWSAAQMIRPGGEGLAITTREQTFYLLPSQLINRRIFADNADEQMAADLLDRAANYFAVKDWRAADVQLRRFRTLAFVEDRLHQVAIDLTGSGPLNEIDRERINRAARVGGDYLIRAQKPDGSFHYNYDPYAESASERDYNILRHAGATIALFQLYEATHATRYVEAARRAVAYLKSRFRRARPGEAFYVLDDDGKAKLGANGLALIVLALQMRLDARSADPASALRLANLILHMQARDGAFASYYDLQGEPEDRQSLYYPGEALLGLIELYRLTGDQRLIEAARRGADYLIETQTRMATLPPDAWLMQALEGLFAIKPDSRYARHAIALAEAMISMQYTPTHAYVAVYVGGYRPGVPRATPAASRAEGLLSALRLARLTGDARAATIAEALKLSARFQLSQQFTADNSFYLARPERVAGGFRESLTSARIRIDYVQHNISALLGIARTVER
jgi:N-acylglucosamine 2-epimerase (GlcNAc 2-epimerase)